MRLGDIFTQLHTPENTPPLSRTRRNELWRALLPHVEESVRVARPQAPPSAQDQVVGEIYYKLLKKNPVEAILRSRPHLAQSPTELDRVCSFYLSRMARTAWLDFVRAQERAQRHLGEEGDEVESLRALPLEQPEEESQRERDEQQMIARFRELLEKVFQHAKSARAPRYRDALEASWKHINARCFARKKLREILAEEGLGPDTKEEDFIRARDRFYQSQKRLREELLRAIEALLALGQLSPSEAFLAREACRRWLVRCQRRKEQSVSQRGEEPTR